MLFRLIVGALLLLSSPALAWTHGAGANSILGMNLAGPPGYSSPQQPFLNIFKTGQAWQTRLAGTDTGEEVSLYKNCLDANGYPTTLSCLANTFNSVSAEVFFGINSSDVSQPTYRSGDYLLQWNGNTNVSISRDATVSCTTSPCKVTVASPTSLGLLFTFTCTGAGCSGGTTNFSNVSVIYCATWNGSHCSNGADTLLAGGEKFDPVFIAKTRPFKNLRFMDWMATTNNFQTNWTNRPTPGFVFWTGSPTNATINGNSPDPSFGGIDDGVPAEVMFALCNELAVDCWFNMPPLANDTYVTNFATLAHTTLNRGHKVYVEYANENFNQKLCAPSGTMITNCVTQVSVLCNSILGSQCPYPASFSAFQANAQFFAYQAVHLGAIWKTAWGADAASVVRVYGGQNGNSGQASTFLPLTMPGFITGTVGQNVDAMAVAPYFTVQIYQIPAAWTALAPDGGLTQTFADIETGLIPTAVNTGNCGNGAGVSCTPVDTAHFTFTSGLSLPATPTNGQIIAMQMNATATASAGQIFLKVDGGTQFPLINNDGNCPGTNYPVGPLAIGHSIAFIFTNAIAGCGAGTLTAGWVPITDLLPQLGQINVALAGTQANCNEVTADGPGLLIGYEFGQGFVAGDAVHQNLYVAAVRDARMAVAYTQILNGIKTMTGCTIGIFNHYNDIFAVKVTGNFGYWGALENFQQTTSPEYGVLSTFH